MDVLADWLRIPFVTLTGCEAVRGVRLAVEAHIAQTHFTTRSLFALRMLRRAVGQCCCMQLTSRVREPLSHYVSTWVWGARPLFGNTLGVGMLQWAPHNLQSTLLLRGDHTGWLKGGLGKKTSKPLGLTEVEKTLRIVSSDYDLIWPVERFDEGMLVLATRLGLPTALMLNATLVSPRLNGAESFKAGEPLLRRAQQRLYNACAGDLPRCKARMAKLAPVDHRLHQHVSASFDRLLAREAKGRAVQLPWLVSQSERLEQYDPTASARTLGMSNVRKCVDVWRSAAIQGIHVSQLDSVSKPTKHLS